MSNETVIMEKAVYFSSTRKLRVYDLDNYGRIYFGNEFCDELIPSRLELQDAISIASEHRKSLSFVTCYVSEHKIKQYYALIELLAKLIPGSEVVINDWGMLKMCFENGVEPVLGRLLVKQKRDPRIAHFIESLPETARLRLRQMGLNDFFLGFLRKQNIRRIELDNLLQGIDKGELRDSGFSYSVYIPYGYITTTRICFFRNRNKGVEKKFSITPCAHECSNDVLKLDNRHMKEKLLMKGNTIFFKNSAEYFTDKGTRINRIVYEPDIPG